MPITTGDLTEKKAYLKALHSTVKAAPKGNFYFFETKYSDGSKARLLLLGPNVSELKKHLEAKKAALLDEGSIGPGTVLSPKRGKIDAKALEALAIEELVRLADDGSQGSESESESEGADDRHVGDANVSVPGLGKPVRVVLASVIANRREADTIQHASMKAAALDQADKLVERLKKGELSGFSREYVTLEQMLADAKKAPTILAELKQIEPVAAAHSDPQAKVIFKAAKDAYDEGNMLGARGEMSRFITRFGHDAYAEQGIGDDKKAAEAVERVGSLAEAYEAEKTEVERKIAKALADPAKWARLVDEAKALKEFFAKSATLGLRKQIESIESEKDPAKRKAKVEKAILAVQTYITAGTQAVSARNAAMAIGIDYFRLLRHLHAELGKLHH